MYSFKGVCDHWLVAPSIVSNGVEFSVIANFVEGDLSNGGVVVNYGEAQYASYVDGKLEVNVEPISQPSVGVSIFPQNVYTFQNDTTNSIELRDLQVTVTHSFATDDISESESDFDSESIQVSLADSALVPQAMGLCGTVEGDLVFNDGSEGEVANIRNSVEVQAFARSWIVPSTQQFFSEQLPQCGEYWNYYVHRSVQHTHL